MSLPAVFKTGEEGTFGWYTASVRWPVIVQNAIDDLERAIDKVEDTKAKDEGEAIKKQLVQLKRDVIEDAELTALPEKYESFNDYLKENGPQTWLKGDWLFMEIYLYRKIDIFFKQQPNWVNFDIFESLKESTFHSSKSGVLDLAGYYRAVSEKFNGKKDALAPLFQEFIEISLWGNATDLSLLANATLDDIKSIQDSANRLKQKSNILVDDTTEVFKYLENFDGDARVDFILDNSGFELYTDLLLSLFLLDFNLASSIKMHGKDIPYMVSDVMIKDFDNIIKDLDDPNFFSVTDRSDLEFISSKIKKYVAEKKLVIEDHPFWTTPLDFWAIDPSETKYGGADVHRSLAQSQLCIFKGDLNYRKLTGDRHWKRTTSWTESIGPLKNNGLTTLSLRTAKADVIVGLTEGKDEELCSAWEKLGNKYGSWWASSGKWAVICFNEGKNA